MEFPEPAALTIGGMAPMPGCVVIMVVVASCGWLEVVGGSQKSLG